MTKRLYLVRHGETPMNVARQLQGITDANLTAKGVMLQIGWVNCCGRYHLSRLFQAIANGRLKRLGELLRVINRNRR